MFKKRNDANQPQSPQLRMNPYLTLTDAFNTNRTRAILSSGQAVVWHRLTIMSKDGDWIVREDEEALTHIRNVLAEHGAIYRFGAPLDLRWLSAGWSSRFEIPRQGLNIRPVFVTRPARIDGNRLAKLWTHCDAATPPFVDLPTLINIKKTNREEDYAIIGELARHLDDPLQCLLESRSPRDLLVLAQTYPNLLAKAVHQRPALNHIHTGEDALAAALDAERRQLMRINEHRLNLYHTAGAPLREIWSEVSMQLAALPLHTAHERFLSIATNRLPTTVPGGWP